MGRRKTTVCPQGHPRTEENTYVYAKTGARSCKICNRESQKKTIAREKELDRKALEWIKQ